MTQVFLNCDQFIGFFTKKSMWCAERMTNSTYLWISGTIPSYQQGINAFLLFSLYELFRCHEGECGWQGSLVSRRTRFLFIVCAEIARMEIHWVVTIFYW